MSRSSSCSVSAAAGSTAEQPGICSAFRTVAGDEPSHLGDLIYIAPHDREIAAQYEQDSPTTPLTPITVAGGTVAYAATVRADAPGARQVDAATAARTPDPRYANNAARRTVTDTPR